MTRVLAASIVTPDGDATRGNLYFFHGIYGRGKNWAPVARALAERRRDWQSVLVDLRGHGDSPTLPPPQTVKAAAGDVARLSASSGLEVHAVLGHSFGGKVALAFAEASPAGLEQVWLIDSTPAPKVPDGSAWRMLHVLKENPGPFPSRQTVVDLIRQAAFSELVANWMASNVVWRDGEFRWRLDFDVMEALLQDFFQQDFWPLIDAPPAGLTIHVVKATESTLLGEDACAHIEEAASRHGRVRLHRVRGGHWLNMDNPDAITTLLAEELPPHG